MKKPASSRLSLSHRFVDASHRGRRHSEGVIDRYVCELPAKYAFEGSAGAAARNGMSNPLDSPKFLQIQVEQPPGMFALVALDWGAPTWISRTQPPH
jgi:hypothetical protein